MENRKTYRTRLDFDKVLDRVADLAVSTESREKIRDSEPYTDPARVTSELNRARPQLPGFSQSRPSIHSSRY